jgi:hypothetical protein
VDRVSQPRLYNHFMSRKVKAEYQKKWRLKNPEMVKGHWLRKYWPNCSWQEALNNYNNLVNQQNNKCAICKMSETAIEAKTKRVRELSVDHCHVTNKVRGLLCSTCNRGLGYFKDSALVCESASEYLKTHEQP